MRWAGLVLAALVLAGCSSSDPGDAGPEASPSPSRSIRTLSPLPMPTEPPPTGRLLADMRQSSRDAAAGRMEVWINNDTAAEIAPTRITYRDPRYRTALPGSRLEGRSIPSQSERGFPLYLPRHPACDHPRGTGTVTVEYGEKSTTIPVEDSTDVAGRYSTARCLELAIGRVADLSWDDEVPFSGKAGDPGTLTLVVQPTGDPGAALVIDTVSGTPILTPVDTDVWRPDATVRGTDAPSRIELPVKPNRCDHHAFLESGGATAFKIGLHLDGKPGQITLRMSVPGAKNAIDFAKASCGDLDTVSGG
jgi:hypothetical protein